jgi:hypothetical protein
MKSSPGGSWMRLLSAKRSSCERDGSCIFRVKRVSVFLTSCGFF